MFTLAVGVSIWYVYDGERWLRETLLDELRPVVGQSLDFNRISLHHRGATLRRFTVDISPRVSLEIEAVDARVSYFQLLKGGIKLTRALDEIILVRPHLILTPSKRDTTSSWEYKPFPLKPFSNLTFLRQLRIQDASIETASDTRQVLADSISGTINFKDLSEAKLQLIGRMIRMPDVELRVEALADLFEGSFHMKAKAGIEDVSVIALPQAFADMDFKSGSMDIQMEIFGSDSLTVDGEMVIADMNVNYGDLLYLEHGTLNGNILDPILKLNGSFDINGIHLPFNGTVSDLFAMEWDLHVQPPEINLTQLDNELLGIPPLSGNINLKIDIDGEGIDWSGDLSLEGDGLKVNGIQIDALDLRASAENRIINLERFILMPLGSQLVVTGSHDIGKKSTSLDWIFQHQWEEVESNNWSKIERPTVESRGKLTGTDGFWDGRGKIRLSDGDGNEILNGSVRIIDQQCNIFINPIDQSGQIKLSFGFSDGKFSYRLDEDNFHFFLKQLLRDRYLPEFLSDYSIDMGIKGYLNETDLKMSWQSDSTRRSGSIKGKLRRTQGGWNWGASVRFHLSDDQSLSGVMKGDYRNGQLNIEQTTLRDHLGRTLFDSESLIQLSTHSSIDKRFPLSHLSIELDSLPAARLLEFVVPGLTTDYQMLLSGKIETRSDSISWIGKANLIYPDSVSFIGYSNGYYTGSRITLEHLHLEESITQQNVLNITGSLNLNENAFDSLAIVAGELPLERILQIFVPTQAEDYSGLLNARIIADGDLHFPDLTADIHLTSGKVRKENGYWANVNVTTVDSFYWVNQINFGQGVSGMLDLAGLVHRYNYTYDLGVLGRNVNVQSVMRTATGKPGPLSGLGNFDITMERSLNHQLATTQFVVEPGALGPVSFDKMTGIISLTGLDAKKPRVGIDSINIDWGTTEGLIAGVIPLTTEEDIDIAGSVRGEIMTLLHRINPYFNSARGSGHLLFEVGGNIKHPILEHGQFSIRNGKMVIKNVVEEVDRINVKIDVDSSGIVEIGQFEARIEGNSFNISNRFPSETDIAKPLKFADYNLGVIQVSTGSDGIWMVVPGLMESNWGGFVRLRGHGGRGPFELQGPADSPLGIGEVQLRSAIFTYPMLTTKMKSSESMRVLLDFVKSIRWDMRVIPTRGCRYILEMSQLENTPFEDLTETLPFVDIKLMMDLGIDDDPDGLMFTGSVADTLHLEGELTSSSGDINFLDMEFQVDQMSILFNPSDLYPLLQGGAYTVVQDTSSITGGREIRIQLRAGNSTIEDESISQRAGFEDMTFVLEDDQGSSQEEILRLMGYSPDLLLPKLGAIGKMFVEDAIPIREWSRTLEQKAKRLLGIDRLEIESAVAKNLIEWQLNNALSPDSTDNNFNYLRTLDQSRVTVGKYLTRDLYLSYTGVLQSTLEEDVTRLGVVHDWNLQLRLSSLSPNLRVNCQYMYDSLTKTDNLRWSLRYGFYINMARKLYPKWLLD